MCYNKEVTLADFDNSRHNVDETFRKTFKIQVSFHFINVGM